jgi:mannitol/fructose-specific phosphotransferase system IIA component (Ntr-type)
MQLSDYLPLEHIIMLKASTKDTALAELVQLLVKADPKLDFDGLIDAIHQRENMLSTGIGQGMAIPHVRLKGVKRAAMAVGVVREGLSDYESLDKAQVHVVIMIIAPEGHHDTYIRLLAEVAEVLKEDELREAVIHAQTPEEVYNVLCAGSS